MIPRVKYPLTNTSCRLACPLNRSCFFPLSLSLLSLCAARGKERGQVGEWRKEVLINHLNEVSSAAVLPNELCPAGNVTYSLAFNTYGLHTVQCVMPSAEGQSLLKCTIIFTKLYKSPRVSLLVHGLHDCKVKFPETNTWT